MMTKEGIKLTDFDSAFIRGLSDHKDVAVVVDEQYTAPELHELM